MPCPPYRNCVRRIAADLPGVVTFAIFDGDGTVIAKTQCMPEWADEIEGDLDQWVAQKIAPRAALRLA